MISIAKSFLALAPIASMAFARTIPQVSPAKTAGILQARQNENPHFDCFYFIPAQRVLAFVGEMIVPQNNPSPTLNYLWPGLTTADNSGDHAFVLQNVLEGFAADGGKWSYFQNWAVGGRFENDGKPDDRNKVGPVSIGQTLSFSMKIAADGKSWDIDSAGAQDNYDIYEDLKNAIFCGEFYSGGSWQMGDVIFQNIQIVGEGPDTSFCVEGGNGGVLGNPTGKWEGVSASLDENNNAVCNIAKLTMNHA